MPPTHDDHPVVARLAIEDLVARYCDAAARADEAAFRACWTADARWTGPGLDKSGRDAIVRAFATLRARVALALPGVEGVRVAARKPHAPVDGPLDYIEVVVEREKGGPAI